MLNTGGCQPEPTSETCETCRYVQTMGPENIRMPPDHGACPLLLHGGKGRINRLRHGGQDRTSAPGRRPQRRARRLAQSSPVHATMLPRWSHCANSWPVTPTSRESRLAAHTGRASNEPMAADKARYSCRAVTVVERRPKGQKGPALPTWPQSMASPSLLPPSNGAGGGGGAYIPACMRSYMTRHMVGHACRVDEKRDAPMTKSPHKMPEASCTCA